MKKLKYTLIELLAAMSIFIIMMGILFKTFSASAEVATAETTRLSIMSDANVFYQYLTADIKAMSIDVIPAPQDELGTPKRLDEDDVATTTDLTSKDFNLVISGSDVTIEFYSDVTPYNIPALAGLSPFIEYHFNSTNGTITRKHFVDDSTPRSPTYTIEPVILEGVESFDVKVWDDYPGGSEITKFPTPTKPSCITFSVTLTNPSPYVSPVIKERAKRTLSKTLFLNR